MFQQTKKNLEQSFIIDSHGVCHLCMELNFVSFCWRIYDIFWFL